MDLDNIKKINHTGYTTLLLLFVVKKEKLVLPLLRFLKFLHNLAPNTFQTV